MSGSFAESLNRQLQRLQNQPLPEIEAEVAAKRMAWLKEHYPQGVSNPSPRRAYELLFFEYMELEAGDVPVVAESEDRIVWASYNPCPTLEACVQLGLDTRVVCHEAYEKSTQVFIAYLDPHLRFRRSYETIRPYTSHCLEWIERTG